MEPFLTKQQPDGHAHKAVVVDVNSEWINRCNDHIKSKVKFEAIDEQRVINILLHDHLFNKENMWTRGGKHDLGTERVENKSRRSDTTQQRCFHKQGFSIRLPQGPSPRHLDPTNTTRHTPLPLMQRISEVMAELWSRGRSLSPETRGRA